MNLTDTRQEWIGRPVFYTDTHRKCHFGLICAVWQQDEDGHPTYINLVYVSDDPSKNDQYGRQIQREATSVPVKSDVNSAGRYFTRINDIRGPLQALKF